MKNIYLTFLSLIISIISISQDSNSVYQITNQLGFSGNSKAVYKGKLLTNFNYSYSIFNQKESRGDLSSYIQGLSISVGYGILKRLDVSFATGYSFVTHETNYDQEKKTIKVMVGMDLIWEPWLT